MEVEQIEQAYAMILEKPDQAYLKYKLAEALYLRGMVVHACAIAHHALQQMPKSLFPDEHRSVVRWVDQSKGQTTATCMNCGAKSSPENVYCQGCGSDYLADYARGRWLGSSLAVRLVAAWVAAVVSLVGGPYILATPFAPPLSGTLIVVQLAVCGWLVWVGFFKKEKRSS